jgi:hypothetical protein
MAYAGVMAKYRALRQGVRGLVASMLLLVTGWAAGAAYTPADDAAVLEHLPYRALEGARGKRPAARTLADPLAAAAQARHYMALAREQGDPRYAGYALAVLRPWREQPAPPPAVDLMLAVVQQYQHDFDPARQRLLALVRRPSADPAITAQAWLMLATLARLQGHYAESDRACNQVASAALMYALACRAENAGLRGQTEAARAQLTALLANPALRLPAQQDTRRWLLTSLAELEERAGQTAAAERNYREALAAMDPKAADSYLVLAYTDFLRAQGRHHEVLKQLASLPQPLSDAALLRRAMAERLLRLPAADTDAALLDQRFAAQRERGDGASRHGREFALFELVVRGKPAVALAYARDNLAAQKEPVDLLLLAQAAQKAGDAAGLRELRAQVQSQGLKDARIQQVLAREGV